MRFTNFVAAAAAAGLVGPSLASDISAHAVIDQVQDEPPANEMPVHGFAGLFTFETEEDWVETPLILQQIQAAYLMAANEVHDMSEIRYDSMLLKSSMHDTVHTIVYPRALFDEVEDEAVAVASGIGSLRGIATGETDTELGRRASREEFNRIRWRGGYDYRITCYLCGGRRLEESSSAADLARLQDFYMSEEGTNIKKIWQRRFCRKLKHIPALKNPNRCLINMDFKHEIQIAGFELENHVFALSD